ncbi:uncharacterized protein LOC144356783 [Saccoglossus kowalevskii]
MGTLLSRKSTSLRTSEDFKTVAFHRELTEIIEALKCDNCVTLLDDVKFLVTPNIIGDRIKEELQTFQDVINELEHRGIISCHNVAYLVELLRGINREPLAAKLQRCQWLKKTESASIGKVRRVWQSKENWPTLCLILSTIVILLKLFSAGDYFLQSPSSQTCPHSNSKESEIFFNVPPKYKYYYGQGVHLSHLEKCLDSHQFCLLKGILGQGKKCLSKTYAHDNRNRYDNGVFWLSRRSDIIAMAGYLALHRDEVLVMQSEQNYAFFESAVYYIRQYLASHDRWLVIFTDVDFLPDLDLREMQRIVKELTSVNPQMQHVLYTAQSVPTSMLHRVSVYELYWGLTLGNIHQFLNDSIHFSTLLNETEKTELHNIWKLTGCQPYAVSRAVEFIKEWNFTLEAFLDHWKHLSKEEWLEIFGYSKEREIMRKQLEMVKDLQRNHPVSVNMLLDYIRRGEERHTIPDCKLHAKYNGVSLRAILQDLKNISFVDVRIDTDSKECSFSIPAILRLVLEVALIQRGQLENWRVKE